VDVIIHDFTEILSVIPEMKYYFGLVADIKSPLYVLFMHVRKGRTLLFLLPGKHIIYLLQNVFDY